jgi:hypothetical protein
LTAHWARACHNPFAIASLLSMFVWQSRQEFRKYKGSLADLLLIQTKIAALFGFGAKSRPQVDMIRVRHRSVDMRDISHKARINIEVTQWPGERTAITTA